MQLTRKDYSMYESNIFSKLLRKEKRSTVNIIFQYRTLESAPSIPLSSWEALWKSASNYSWVAIFTEIHCDQDGTATLLQRALRMNLQRNWMICSRDSVKHYTASASGSIAHTCHRTRPSQANTSTCNKSGTARSAPWISSLPADRFSTRLQMIFIT